MRRGDIVVAHLDPAVGSEADKRRPAVVVSNNGANRAAEESGRGVVTIVPLTSSIATVHVFQVLISCVDSGLRADSKAQAEQIRAISIHRIDSVIGHVPDHLMTSIEHAIRRHLDL